MNVRAQTPADVSIWELTTMSKACIYVSGKEANGRGRRAAHVLEGRVELQRAVEVVENISGMRVPLPVELCAA